MDIRSVQAFVAGFDFKLHLLSFSEGLESIHRNRREVNENIFSTLLLYEAIALRIIEPLHLSLDHGNASGMREINGRLYRIDPDFCQGTYE